ncbi:aminotransferase class I/II-fold pyridoxal phosphate-dependent enzyme [Cohnella rhizosphaerae]|uniref:PLP-dependent aminotransferase family protein n=1 Tax=Cohnella rhizosphaerae TaxID=1457232 RepID=A0A9X4KPN6_9BACL|nr:PLP-dependent aminotransferase family protein [Cohnella rhizosphaerae]MDG0808789.1 PLP-dependent aminotransferase family protein [Cohnella rhizosphaerae]
MINWMGGWPAEGLLAEAEWQEKRQKPSVAAAEAIADRLRRLETEKRLASLVLSGQLGPYWRPADGPGQWLLTDDADEALRLATKALLKPGDAILVERPTSRSALQLFARAGAAACEVEGSMEGMDPEALAKAIAAFKPRAVYASLTCSDPAGWRWSEERRKALLRLCAQAGVALLLDERQSLTCGWTTNLAEGEETGPAAVIGALPSGLVSGMRLGWLQWTGWNEEGNAFVPVPTAKRPDREREALDDREALLRYWNESSPTPALETLRFIYRTRHALLAERIEQTGIRGLVCKRPEAGSHAWLKLPDGLEGEPLLKAAWLEGVLFQPGAGYYAAAADRSRLRLTPVHSDEREISEGVRRLRQTIASFTGRAI